MLAPSPLLPAVLLLAAIVASSADGDHRKLEAFVAHPNLWTKGQRALADDSFDLAIGLHAEIPRALEDKFWAISDPTHALYGKHLSQEEADALTKPNTRALNDMKRWLTGHGIAEYSFSAATNRMKACLETPELSSLTRGELGPRVCALARMREGARRRMLRASRSLQIPASLIDHVSYINLNSQPIGRSLKEKRHHQAGSGDKSKTDPVRMGSGISPEYLREWYGVPRQTSPNETNAQGVPEFYDEAWSDADLTQFYKQYMGGERVPTLVTHHVPDRDDAPYKSSGEASLDLQYITALSPRTTTYVWSQIGTNPTSPIDEPFVEWADEILKMNRPPYVVSISYSDDEEHIFNASEAYARSFDPLLMKLGTRGVSVFMSSGDDGVAGQRPGLLKFDTNDKTAWCKQHGPQWPTSSPYLTSVGATMLAKPADVSDPFFYSADEVVCSSALGSSITSGGGFSNKYARPAYQDDAVQAYLSTRNLPPSTFFNASGRAYPDVTAFGNSFLVVVKGVTSLISGTSASSPVFASMITLVNDMRLNAGKPPLGFVNPALYKIQAMYPHAFNDIVVGTNAASMGIGKPVCEDSFHAERGWDAVSGLGSPNFQVLSQLLFDIEEVLKGQHVAGLPLMGGTQVDFGISTTTILAVSISALVVAVLTVCGVICYVRRNTKTIKSYQEIDGDKADTPKYPTPTQKDSSAIFTIDDHDEDEEAEVELTEVKLDR
ncbi:Aste57867_20682 [Aphanomyces stellatus]|uniref:subtilisin n=1 Tax=Aphanomyces stellatus TaxID=120398 RepID=A0A485LG53_9STRA|nr:hypothetical protein As57867_020614 [Aphanomyces stellatus]VFT97362.1 Aste57867_20682 [Aphanomyces stellatus]